MNITNVYPIKNLIDIECQYRLYRIKGLIKSSDDFQKNKEQLIKKLSFESKSPCAFISENNDFFVAQPINSKKLSEHVTLIRCQVKLELQNETRTMNFGNLTENELNLALRFLKFAISDPLFSHPELWQPSPGKPFFYKKPDREINDFSFKGTLHRGFIFRLVKLPNKSIGICIDITSKYLSNNYLPSKLTEEQFQNIKDHNCVYEFGDLWYEITLRGLEGLSASEYKLKNNFYLSDYARQKIRTGSKQFERITNDGSVVCYYNNSAQPFFALSSLCRLTIDTNDPSIQSLHYKTQLSPKARLEEIEKIVSKFFSNLKFGNSYIVLDDPLKTTAEFPIPDLKFGNNTILSLTNTPNAVYSSIKDFGKMKLNQLRSSNAGFFERKNQLQEQFLVLPKSIANTSGNAFLHDLQLQFAEMYGDSNNIQYKPQIITYNDNIDFSIPRLGKEIIESIESEPFRFGGFALVIIPRLKNSYKEDKLASLVYRQMRQRDIHSSIIHDKVILRSYEKFRTDDGGLLWRHKMDSKIQNKLRGYLFNVVLTKILLLNSCWPFMLENGLTADVTIGIDVKNHTAGFTFFYGDNTTPNFYPSSTQEHEKLSYEHIKSQLIKCIKNEQRLLGKEIRRITIHRDGRLFEVEKQGIIDAFSQLSNDGLISPNYDLNVIEIPKHPSIPIRFFTKKINPQYGTDSVFNPIIGTYFILENEMYLATTGSPYFFNGTANPIHIIHRYGSMSFESICQDLFYLTNLTWTKIDSCLRVPITLKLNDLRLKEEAGDYEEDKFNFEKILVDTNE